MPNTIVKANYTCNPKSAANSARYYATRINLEGSRETRLAFSKDGDSLTRADTKAQLEQTADAPYHYRMILSPGAENRTPGDLKAWTRDVMQELEAQQGTHLPWLAYEHAAHQGHTDHAHVHVIVASENRLARHDLTQLRDSATERWDLQAEYIRELSGDTLEPTLTAEKTLTQEHDLGEGISL